MGNDINKIYNKAMDYYQKGDIDKALSKCEEGISQDLKNTNLLNLKGLILYVKGDLNGAITVWTINKDFNDDTISKVYIKDAKRDFDKLEMYQKAQDDIKELLIDDAISKLEKCTESDFNSINVNTALALCYLRKGNCLLATEYVENALKIHSNNKLGISIQKQIEKFLEDPKDEYIRKMKKIVTGVIVAMVVVVGGIVAINNSKNDIDEVVDNNIELGISDETSNDEKDINNKDVEIVDNSQEVNDESVDKLENDEKTEENQIEEEKEDKYTSVNELKEAYIQGTTYYENEDYDKAIELLQGAYDSSIDCYLKDDILFYLGTSYFKANKNDEGIKYFEEYAEIYSDKTYIKEVYYNLALSYQEKNIEKSKQYAQIISTEYSSSIYNNKNINKILSE